MIWNLIESLILLKMSGIEFGVLSQVWGYSLMDIRRYLSG